MEALPFVDDHSRVVAASPERTWRALVAVVGGGAASLPGPLAAAWGLDQKERRGDWAHPVAGDTIPGFAVAHADPPRTLTLGGRHRFSRYELRFTLDPAAGGTEVHARTSAVFPGVLGGAYRLLVIGSGGHVLAVRGLLARIARRAEAS